jgi:hypothetical protein
MRILAFTCLIFLLTACQKPAGRACWKKSGVQTESELTLDAFQYVRLHDGIELILIQDTVNFLKWEAGDNLMNFLEAQIMADTLHLKNLNHCRFLRYKNGKVKAYLHFKSIKELFLANSESVSTSNLWSADQLLVHLEEGVGKVNLELEVDQLEIRNIYGWQPLNLEGQCKALFVDLDGSASLNSSGLLVADSISFRSSSPISSQINADGSILKAQLYGPGDLYYTGLPSAIYKSEYNTGKVRPK